MSRSPVAGTPAAVTPTSVEDVLALVRADGGRVTNAKRLLVATLFDRSEHLTAEDLTAEVQSVAPDIHQSTIYRNLDELERLGVITHTHLGHGPSTYHLAARTHGHLVCERCGATTEISDSMFDTLARRATKEFGFDVNPHHSAVLGLCRDCQGLED